MRFRTYKNTDLLVSEVGFGLWTISTGWWGQFTEGEAIALMHKAFDLGMTLFDAADTYGNGLSEELIAKAFPKQRDEIVIATKVGYDFVTHGEARGRGQRAVVGLFLLGRLLDRRPIILGRFGRIGGQRDKPKRCPGVPDLRRPARHVQNSTRPHPGFQCDVTPWG